ncbi:hypothetical protein CSA57_04580 [candidate division KSB3 bacterium]|nr:MAG: hypothetical protein CSA57_04580 [candidate division KSB3 bacterium]
MRYFFNKQPGSDEAQRIIRSEMAFLLEQHERWFEKQLQARLLREGCNFPICLARQSFYVFMGSELLHIVPDAQRSKLQSLLQNGSGTASATHPQFHHAIRFCAAQCPESGRLLALAVTKAIHSIMEEWRLPAEIFQEDLPAFRERIQCLAARLWENFPAYTGQTLALEALRRRLYLTLTTSLLSKIPLRQEFEQEFSSIPDFLSTVQTEHTHFCRLMNFCQERSPYFQIIVSRTFWRTLETFFLEHRASLAAEGVE